MSICLIIMKKEKQKQARNRETGRNRKDKKKAQNIDGMALYHLENYR